MAMGLVAREPDALVDLDAHYAAEMAQRRALLAENRAIVFASLPCSDVARQAVLDRLVEVLPRRYPTAFSRNGRNLHNHLTGEDWNLEAPGMDPLEVAGRLVQHDLCLMQPGPDGPVLTAGVLCFPSRWSLVEKLGLPMAEIHAHVPFYGERLARPVDRFFSVLAEGRLVERLNWGVTDDPALFQPGGKWRRRIDGRITAENAGDSLFLRTERQTLSRVGPDGTILFTIRTRATPLREIAADRGVALDLASAIEALPEEMAHYKSILPFRDAVLGYLRRG